MIFKGAFAKALAAGGFEFKDGLRIAEGALDPTASAVDAPKGSLYVSSSTGKTYQKQDSGSSTNWYPLGTAPGQVVTVGATGCDFATISTAYAAITDATALKTYAILVAPGTYVEDVACKPFIELVGTSNGPAAPAIIGKITSLATNPGDWAAINRMQAICTATVDGEVCFDLENIAIADFFVLVQATTDIGFTAVKQLSTSGNLTPFFSSYILVNHTYNGCTKDIVALEQGGDSGNVLSVTVIDMRTKSASGTISARKLGQSGGGDWSGFSDTIKFDNVYPGSTAIGRSCWISTASTGSRLASGDQISVEGDFASFVGYESTAAANSEFFAVGATMFVDTDIVTASVSASADTDSISAWIASTNRDMGGTGDGICVITPYHKLETGFVEWGGTAGTYWSYVPATRTFTVNKSIGGMIKSSAIVAAAGQSVVLDDFAVNFIYIDNAGVLQSTTTTNYGELYRSYPVVFEVWVESGRIITCNEAHPVEFTTAVSVWAHNGFRSFLQNATSNLSVNSSAGRTLNFNGANQILDHGVVQDIASTLPVTWNVIGRRTSDGKAYIAYTQQAIPTYYDTSVSAIVVNAGAFVVGRSYEIRTVGTTDYTLIGAANNNVGTCFTATGVGAGTGTAYQLTDDSSNGNWFVYRLGVLKGSLNSANPQWVCILDDGIYGNQSAARNAIAAGTILAFPSEIDSLEGCQVGFGIIQGNGTGGSGSSGAVTPVTSLQVIGAQYVAGGTSTAASLITLDTTGFVKFLDGTITTVQALANAVDELGSNATFIETIQDLVGAMATDSTSIDFTYDDATGTFTGVVIYGTEPPAVSSSTSGTAGTAATAARSNHSHDLGAHTHTDAASGGLIVSASPTQQGAVTTAAQSFAGLKTFDNGVATDTIAEKTAAAGVTIDSVLLKDGQVQGNYALMTTESTVAIASGNAINLSTAKGTERWYAVIGSAAGQNVMNATPFGASAPGNPLIVWLVGRSNDNTVVLTTNDAARGAYVAGGFIELGKGTAVGFKYSPTLQRWIEIARNNFSI